MPGEDECGQDMQLLLCANVMSLEVRDVEAQSNHIFEKANLEIYFRQWQSNSSWSICFIAVSPKGQQSTCLKHWAHENNWKLGRC